ncbi:hypothetical protein G6F46_012142 [Rhizopus delemar]|uniref:Tc1-like transposase DDE domain-containing protein n=1 Tax=Rhizopus delemar TaxID=936053 RepID=A0A9P7CIF1_9FUNG|nr:hypothetical protein G6F55_011855 [Rhizopus delemar]KAG1619705.1 hypothetical protein G6F45_011683 [Rhizopus arrhizus]KAG1488542.1 hypothetical protein G6F54_012023 [Rhizopus delemar]KAG1563753.1 hypothetical protein G6F50_011696 [Rhizopus delemar]KAG1607652.1 hypothetical protein G6F46_012142 [Rhizopus delemar]
MDNQLYQVFRQTLENEHNSKAEKQPTIVEIQSDLKQSRKKIELLDLVIEEGLSARKAGAIVGIVKRTAQNYVKTYEEDEEKRLPGGKKQRVSWERKLQSHHTNFLCVCYEKNAQAVLWQARGALLEAFSEVQSITLSGLHRHLVLHASLTLKKLETIVSSRNTLGNLQIRRDRVLEWKSDENMNWHKNCVFIDEAGFNMHIRRNFGRSKRGMPAKAVIPANRGITVSIIGAICEKEVIDLTLRKSKAVQKKTNRNKKRKTQNDKAEVAEANARIGTRSEHFIEFLIGVMVTLDQFDMKGRYLIMHNAAIHKVTEVKDLIASRGYKVIYLPPYSPFLNPIELFWSKLKLYQLTIV